MKTRTTSSLLAAALVAVALAGCASSTPTAGTDESAASSPSSSPSASADADAAVDTTTLGKVIVDGKGMTAYVFAKDTADSGSSACTGECTTLWPAITAKSETPQVSGVTGKVGTITGVDGGMQVTVNGLPIYTFAKDTAAGDVNGQGVGGVWYAVSPDGDQIESAESGY
jgi:predicted lipoprotein with Yx(FWY)xxD motif